jgi:MFS family permease
LTTAPAPVGSRFIAAYAFACAGLWVALLAPAMITVAVRVQSIAPADSARSVSAVLASGALVALLANPIFGALSDRTRSRFGRRRPWLIAGMLGGTAALALIAIASTVPMILLGWCLAQLAFNATLAPLMAILPDRVPIAQRGTVSGVLAMCMPIGQIAGTFLVEQLAGNTLLAFLGPAAVGLVAVSVFAFIAPDAPAPLAARAAAAPPEHLGWRLLQQRRDFAWAWLSRVFFVTGGSFLFAYQPIYLVNSLAVEARAVPRLIFQSTLVHAGMVALWSVMAGRLSDFTGKRRILVMGGALLEALGLWLVATADSYAAFLVAIAIAGAGHGIYDGIDLALVTELLPDRARRAAQDLGILNITNALPQVIAPASGPLVLAIAAGNDAVLFAAAASAALLAALLLLPLRHVR